MLRVARADQDFPTAQGICLHAAGRHGPPGRRRRPDLRAGETLGLVGDSGAGKSTTLFEILAMAKVESGHQFLGQRTGELSGSAERRVARGRADRFPGSDGMSGPADAGRRHHLRAAAGPARRPGDRPARTRAPETRRSRPRRRDPFPHEFSGGKATDLIARALSLRPRLLVLDEPVSALDVSIQAGILNLLQRLQAELGLSYLFVSHDLSVIRHLADQVAVMYLGRTIESGEVDLVFDQPAIRTRERCCPPCRCPIRRWRGRGNACCCPVIHPVRPAGTPVAVFAAAVRCT